MAPSTPLGIPPCEGGEGITCYFEQTLSHYTYFGPSQTTTFLTHVRSSSRKFKQTAGCHIVRSFCNEKSTTQCYSSVSLQMCEAVAGSIWFVCLVHFNVTLWDIQSISFPAMGSTHFSGEGKPPTITSHSIPLSWQLGTQYN